MTYKTKNYAFVFAFAAILLAWPMAATVDADVTTADMNLECGVTTPVTIAFGSFSLGTSPDEVDNTMAKLGGSIGTLEVVASDWTGVAQKASSIITVVDPTLGDVFTYETITATVDATTDNGALFTIGASNEATATALALTINTNADAGDIGGVDVLAIAIGNSVILRSDVTGIIGNTVNIAQTTGTGLVVNDATLVNGEDNGVVHMQAEVTKYKVNVDGTDAAGTAYASKTALDVATIKKTLAAQTEPTTSVDMALEILTDSTTLELLPYAGALSQTLTFTATCNES